MLILLDQSWPWLLIGGLLFMWGYALIGLSPADWIAFIIQLFFMPFSDNTKQEKEQIAKPTEEVVDQSPGCYIFILGLTCLLVGLFKLLAR